MDSRKRNKAGHWLPGVSGNPEGVAAAFKLKALDYVRALHKELTPELWRGIIARACRQALEGDAQARDWLTRTMGVDWVLKLMQGTTGADAKDKIEVQVTFKRPQLLLDAEQIEPVDGAPQ